MIAPTSSDVLHLRWPAERFYWAILDTSSMPVTVRSRRHRQRLGYLFESVLPGVAIEGVQAVYQSLPGDAKRILACGLPKNVLKDDVDPSAVTLAPNSAPGFLEGGVALAGLNLLTDSFLPPVIQRLRRRWRLHVYLILTLCTALLIVGLERRTSLHRGTINDLTAAHDMIIKQLLGSDTAFAGAIPGAGAGAGELRLIAQRRRLEQTRSDDLPISEVSDAAAILARLLVLWPHDVHAQTQSISITSSSITVRAAVPTMADAQRLADALSALDQWRLRQPQSEARRDHVDVTLRFEPIPETPSR